MNKLHFLLLAFLPFIVKAQSVKDLKETVSFIYVKDNEGKLQANGTCFFVSIVCKQDPSLSFTYLVTAKHVMQQLDGSFYKEVFVRMNIDSTSKYVRLPLITEGAKKSIYFHTDNSVDLAVVPGNPGQKEFTFRYLDTSLIPDRKKFESYSFAEGTELFFSGLFSPYTGEKKIYPIVRYGRIALLPDERIDFIGKKREIILIEASAFGGNSGSPVFFKVIYPDGRHTLCLGGVLNGVFRDAAEVKTINTTISTQLALYNNGISGITPSFYLNEILFGKELIQHRGNLVP